jgi:hypothetical protein
MRCQPAGEPWAVVALRDSAHAVLGRGAPDTAAEQLRRAVARIPHRRNGSRCCARWLARRTRPENQTWLWTITTRRLETHAIQQT